MQVNRSHTQFWTMKQYFKISILKIAGDRFCLLLVNYIVSNNWLTWVLKQLVKKTNL